MRSLPKPETSAEDAYKKSIEFTEGDLSERLTAQVQAVLEAANAFDDAANDTTLHLILPQRHMGNATNAEMKSVYKRGFSAGNAAGRPIYNKLRKSARHNKCPLCGVNQVTTLDHHLPQSRYAALVVCPNNLVPACSDCNKSKLVNIPTDSGSQTFHPYYDDPNTERWLKAECIPGISPSLEYSVERPEEWTDDQEARANRHLKIFKLAALYASNAADELINLKGGLLRLDADGGRESIEKHLHEQEQTYVRAQLNSWQGAMYRGLLGSEWFLNGGYRSIPD